MKLGEIFKLVRKQLEAERVPSPITKGKVSAAKCREVLDRRLKPSEGLFIADVFYTKTTVEELKKFLKADSINKEKYVTDWNDCDDYAFKLLGAVKKWYPNLAFGVAWSKSHAFNFFIDEKYKLWFIEPQTDLVFPYNLGLRHSKTEAYRPIRMVIM